MKNRIVVTALFLMVSGCFLVSPSLGHEAFKDAMQEHYKLKSASCKACHPDNKNRKIHNKYGKYFLDEFKGKELSKKFAEAETKGEEAVEAYNKVLVAEFKKAVVVVEKKPLTFKDIIEAGLLNGTRMDTDKMVGATTTDGKVIGAPDKKSADEKAPPKPDKK